MGADRRTDGAEDWRERNRANWDARVSVHLSSAYYDVAGFVAGADPLRPHEVEEVGDVAGRSLLHLQCHIGTDTLAWARRGAAVTGVDLSGASVRAARELAARIGADGARFVEADVYDAAAALPGETFDVVYTGVGALLWLPDLDAWARVAAGLLKPGGVFYVSDFHPVAEVVADDGRSLAGDYFADRPEVYGDGPTYTDGAEGTDAGASVQWTHTLGSVVTALAAAGLRIEFLRERDGTLFARYPALRRCPDGFHRFPEGEGYARIPLMFSIRAVKD